MTPCPTPTSALAINLPNMMTAVQRALIRWQNPYKYKWTYEGEYFGVIWNNVTNKILIDIQNCLRYGWNQWRRGHIATTFLHEKAGICSPKLFKSANVKIRQPLQGKDVDQLQRSNQQTPVNLCRRRAFAQINAKIIWFTQRSNMRPMEYTEAQWRKGLRRKLVYDAYIMKEIFI